MRRACLALVLALTACPGQQSRSAPGGPDPMAPSSRCVRIEPSDIDFGEVEFGTVTAPVQLINPSNETTEVRIAANVPPFASGRSDFDAQGIIGLGPGEAFRVLAIFTSVDGLLHHGSRAVTQAGCPDQEITLHALGAGTIVGDDVHFGFVPIGAPTTRQVRLRSSRRAPVTLTLEASPPFSVSGPQVVPALGEAVFDVTVDPVDAGTVRSELTASFGTQRRSVAIVEAFPGEPGLELPLTIELGRLPASDRSAVMTRTATMRNSGTAAIDFFGVAMNPSEVPLLVVLPAALPPRELVTLGLLVSTPTQWAAPGEHTWEVTLATNLEVPAKLTLHATLTNERLCEPSSISAPTSVTASAPTTDVAFVNAGGLPCLVEGLSVSGSGLSLPAGPPQLFVPAMGSATLQLETSDGGQGALRWQTLFGDQAGTVLINP